MPNGQLKTNKDYLIALTQKVDDFIESDKENRAEHRREHSIMWRLIIALPSSLVVLFTIIKLLGG